MHKFNTMIENFELKPKRDNLKKCKFLPAYLHKSSVYDQMMILYLDYILILTQLIWLLQHTFH